MIRLGADDLNLGWLFLETFPITLVRLGIGLVSIRSIGCLDQKPGGLEKVPGTSKVPPGIETEIGHLRLENEIKQGVPKNATREGAIGLGFRCR